MKCSDCKFALFQDEGYSSWTVEGTVFICMVKAHPDDNFDSWYEEDGRLDYAAECPQFVAGDAIRMDVDRDDYADLSHEQKALYDNVRPY